MTFRNRIKAAGATIGLKTWPAIAKRAGVSVKTIHAAGTREESGKPLNLDGETAAGLAVALGRSEAWVRTGAEDGSIDTAEMRFEAIDDLVQINGWEYEKAIRLVRSQRLHEPTAAKFYRNAQKAAAEEFNGGAIESVDDFPRKKTKKRAVKKA